MKLLLDECVPRMLRRDFTGHRVFTVQQMGWSGKMNGELLELIEAEVFNALITTDRNIAYQQNLERKPFILAILAAKKNRYDHLAPLIPERLAVPADAKPGQFFEIAQPN